MASDEIIKKPENSPPDAGGVLPLEELRTRIDRLDASLIELLSERASLVVEVGKAKQRENVPIYVPHREREVLRRALERNKGPLPNRTVEAIFREMMSGSFSLERPLRIGYLGPQGSFSHVAAVRHFGSSVELVDLHEIDHVFEEVASGRCHYGYVPYENSTGGGVTDTLDAFLEHQVTIYAEALLEVNQALLGHGPPDRVRRIYSKPQAFSQCRRWLARHYPNVEQMPESSTSAAVKRAAADTEAAAIGSAFAGSLYGVPVLAEKIQDKADNITRFLVIGKDAAKRTGDDKTTIMFVTSHKPGALVDVLASFRDASVNLSHIEKRPSGAKNWEYTFFVDAEGHRDDDRLKRAVDQARSHCVSLTVLGSYPRAERILS